MSEFSEGAIRAACEIVFPDAFGPDISPDVTREATAFVKDALSAAVKMEMQERALTGTRVSQDAIVAGARALAKNRGFSLPDDYENCTPKSQIGMAVADAKTCLQAVFFDDVLTQDNVALRDAFAAAVHLIDRYRTALAGKPVRDLDEAEVAFQVRQSKIGLRTDKEPINESLPTP